MFLFNLIKLILIFPFILYIVIKFYTRNKRRSYLIVAPLYLVSLLLWLKYICGVMLGVVITGLIMFVTVYATIELKKPAKLTNKKIIRYSLMFFGRIYINIYIILLLIGISQEFLKIR